MVASSPPTGAQGRKVTQLSSSAKWEESRHSSHSFTVLSRGEGEAGTEHCRQRASVVAAVTILIHRKLFYFNQGRGKFCFFVASQISHDIGLTEISSWGRASWLCHH